MFARARNPMTADGKYKLLKKIGSGSFGDVYEGKCIRTGNLVAIKVEKNTQVSGPLLKNEAKVYGKLKGFAGFPRIYHYGNEMHYNLLVMDRLGSSLEDLFNFCHRQFSIKTVLLLALPMINRIETLHYKCYVHRDIKPDNFLMGFGEDWKKLFLIDFGLAKKYRDTYTNRHIMFNDNKHLTGSARYASINTHLGIQQTRRDDMESLGYVLVYFIIGQLPWQGMKAKTKKQKHELIVEKKMSTPPLELGENLPEAFGTYLAYCRHLRFEEQPDYSFLKQLFRDLRITLKYEWDFEYDWKIQKDQINKKHSDATLQLEQLKLHIDPDEKNDKSIGEPVTNME